MSQTATIQTDRLRHAFAAIPEDVAHHGTEPPAPNSVYVVPGHESALNPDTPVVVGDRGTGKSFWSAALNHDATRVVIGRQLRRLRLDRVRVGWGYSSDPGNRNHPSRRVLRKLVGDGFRAEDIWRTVVLHQLVDGTGHTFFAGAESWAERVQLVAADPETEERLFHTLDAEFQDRGERHLVVFDALDRLGDDWDAIRPLLQGLLRMALDLRAYQAIRTKLFLRPDMWEDETVWAFPDASKLTQDAPDDEHARPYLPPHALAARTDGQREEDALTDAAIEIGVMSRTADGRLNIPDLFRVAAGIGRRGGVRAIR